MSVENENQDFPWGHLTEESSHLGWSCLPLSCVVSAPFFQCFIFNSLALWVLLLTSGHKPFLKEAGSYKSPIRQSIKTSTIHSKTDLPPDTEDLAGSAVMPLGVSARRVKGKGVLHSESVCVLGGLLAPRGSRKNGLWPPSMHFSSGLKGELCVSTSSSSDFSNHISGIFLSPKDLLQS